MNLPLKAFLLSLFTCLLLIPALTKGEPDPSEGEQLFEAECQQCHAFGSEMVGPDLANVTERRDQDWLVSFIQNAPERIDEGDEIAVELSEEYAGMMPAMTYLDEDEIRDIIAYMDQESDAALAEEDPAPEEEVVDDERPAAEPEGFYGIPYDTVTIFLVVVFLILLVLVILLNYIKGALRKTLHEQEHPGEPVPPGTWEYIRKQALAPFFGLMRYTNPVFGVLSLMGIAFIIIVAILYDNAQYVGSQQGYAPEQPIPFDHEIHAGQHEIDCQYCHTDVETSKHANIPAVGVCMNCHDEGGIKTDHPDVQKVIEAYNNDEPIEWERVHNIADHAFFSHAQHVNVAELDCESCHGQVEEMPKVEQVEDMTMAWCIDCHRETEVDLDNEYYTETFDFLEGHEELTISELGGTDCSSCHY